MSYGYELKRFMNFCIKIFTQMDTLKVTVVLWN